ncbi:PAS domain S-box protein [Cytobacillus sp. FJAT-54145]|uniref:histidine kinase n=1 Tax=Cytobacillus spartinae TaxID=3299023 RepID=A0ABW6K9D5_9BACI
MDWNEVNSYTQTTPDLSGGTILIDRDGIISYANDRADALFGYAKNGLREKQITSILPEFNFTQTKPSSMLNARAKHNQGTTFMICVISTPLTLEKKNFYMLEIHLPKTQHPVLAQVNELRELKIALDESTIVAYTDDKGIITYVNEKFCEISKYSAEELIGHTHRMVNSGFHSKVFFEELWRTISSGNVWHGEIRNKAKDGTFYWVDTTIVPFLNESGEPYKYLAIRKDITHYKQVVEDLNKSMQELVDLKFALDTSSIVAITDHKGFIKFVNDKFSKISKYSKEELIGKDHRIINSAFHSKEFFKDLWRTISSGNVWKGEIKNQAKDGSYYWVDTTIVPFLDDYGKPYQYLAIRYEITERKKAEEELQNMMTKIIDIQEEERKRLSRNLHDGIGQNLYSHLISINLLQSQIGHPLLDHMQQEATELIEEVRRISQELRPSVLDDLGLVPAIRSYLLRYSDHYKIDVQFDCYLHSRLTANKEITIYRIIQEALTNIRKYAKTNEAYVTIRELDSLIRVLIEDKGKGFVLNETKRGVGLFSMEERARAVNGEIHIQTNIGEGTKIILEVPL